MKLHYNITEQNPIIKDNYPYGFRLKTKIKYYVESVKKKGDRFVSQTLNPKTNKWNKPKKSVYSNVIVIVEDERGHIDYINFNYYFDKEEFKKFLDKIDINQLNELQQDKIKEFKAILKTREYIDYKCEDITNLTEEEKLKREEEQNKIKRKLCIIHQHHLKQEGL